MLRLSLILSGIFAVGFAVAVLVAVTLGQNANDRRVDTALASLAGAANLENAAADTGQLIVRAPDALQGLPSPFSRAVSRGGGTVRLDRNLMGADVWRVLVTQDSQGSPVMVALPVEDVEDVQELLAGILWSTAGVVIILTLSLGIGAGLLAQRRLARIDDTLGRLAGGDLTARTGSERSKDDIDDIARQLDVTAAELERLVTQTRHLSASIAHDLRTPLARMRAQLEMLPEGEERGAALEEAGRLSEIFDTIMRIARVEAAQGRSGFETVALGPFLQDIYEIYEAVVEDEGKELILDLQSPGEVSGDRQMLLQVVANLIQNALVHGGDKITLTARGTTLTVADNGPGVDPDQYDEILKPMVRLDAARTKSGSGLGLALVRAVADRHDAKLELSSAEPQGLQVSLKFTDM